MLTHGNLARLQFGKIKIAHVALHAGINTKAEHLIKVAIVQVSQPVDGDGVAAHDTRHSRGVKRVHKFLYVVVIVAGFQEKIQKTTDWNIGDGEQVVK